MSSCQRHYHTRILKLVWLAAIMAVGFSAPAYGQDLRLRGFSDVVFSASDDPDVNSAFSLGQFDLYLTSELSERMSFLGEVVFEYDDSFVVDVERVGIRYLVSDQLNLVLGKHHTPIGAWNTAYHHGSLLQPTISRPLMFLFEDEGGVLPIHTTGLWAWGNLANGFTYDMMVGNGIGSDPVSDNNNGKSVTLKLTHSASDRLRVGVTGYRDHISAGTPSLQSTEEVPVVLPEKVTQSMVGGHLIFSEKGLEVMAEILFISNQAETATTRTVASYAYGGYQVGALTPYLRYDRLSFEEGEPYFPFQDVEQFLVGLSRDINPFALVRVELRNNRAGGESVWGAAFQLAFAF